MILSQNCWSWTWGQSRSRRGGRVHQKKIDKRNWNDILAFEDVARKSLEQKHNRNWCRITVTLPIEKLMEQFIGIPCVRSYDVRFRLKAREPSLILNDLIVYTKEAIKLDVNIARTQMTSSCIFAPFKGTREEN